MFKAYPNIGLRIEKKTVSNKGVTIQNYKRKRSNLFTNEDPLNGSIRLNLTSSTKILISAM